jgi:hypothetical protein
MADYLLAIDSQGAAVTAAATQWQNLVLGGFAMIDGAAPALAGWINAFAAESVGLLGAHVWSAYTLIYKMQGMDAVTTARATWLASGTPDFAASRYTGALTTPLRDVVVVDVWST